MLWSCCPCMLSHVRATRGICHPQFVQRHYAKSGQGMTTLYGLNLRPVWVSPFRSFVPQHFPLRFLDRPQLPLGHLWIHIVQYRFTSNRFPSHLPLPSFNGHFRILGFVDAILGLSPFWSSLLVFPPFGFFPSRPTFKVPCLGSHPVLPCHPHWPILSKWALFLA